MDSEITILELLHETLAEIPHYACVVEHLGAGCGREWLYDDIAELHEFAIENNGRRKEPRNLMILERLGNLLFDKQGSSGGSRSGGSGSASRKSGEGKSCGSRSGRAIRKTAEPLAGLKALCSYDMRNGTVYALKWTNILNRFSYQFALSGARYSDINSNKKLLCLLFEKTGTQLFTHRFPKHFADGSSYSIDLILLVQRAFSLLCTPLGSMLADWSKAPVMPGYLQAGDLLRDLFCEKLRPLDCAIDSKKAASYADFMRWKANTCLRGRGGYLLEKVTDQVPSLTDRQRAISELACYGRNTEQVWELLAFYDFECGTKWSTYLATTLSRIEQMLA